MLLHLADLTSLQTIKVLTLNKTGDDSSSYLHSFCVPGVLVYPVIQVNILN